MSALLSQWCSGASAVGFLRLARIAFVIGVTAACMQVTASGLIDGSFEGGTQAAGACERITGVLPLAWKDNTCWNRGASADYQPTIAPARSGKSLAVTVRRGGFQLVQPFRLAPEHRYTASVWLRADKPMVVKLSLRQAGPPYLDLASRHVRVQDQWVRVRVSGYSHGLASVDVHDALFMVSSSGQGSLWLDDALLQSERVSLSLPAAKVAATFLGTHVMHAVNLPSGMSQPPVGTVRVWDSHRSQWHQVQKAPPKGGKAVYDWGVLDERVRLADQRKTPLLMVLGGYAPAWASLPEGADLSEFPDCHRCDQSPTRISDWRAWTRDVAKRFKGRSITAWEIWNEPNFPPEHPMCPSADVCRSGLGSMYRGTPEQLLELQNEAAKVLKEVDPTTLIVSPGISYHHRNYLDHYLSIGGGRLADAVGYHLYLDGAPELLLSHILALRAVLDDHGLSAKPLWNTESAISEINTSLDPAVMRARRTSAMAPTVNDLAPAYLARMYLISWAGGFERVYHYAWDDQHGWPSSPTVVNKSNNAVVRVNASGTALAQVRDWMVGRTLVRFEAGQNGGVWRAVFKDDAGVESQVLWHPGRPADQAVSVELPSQFTHQCDLAGACQKIDGRSIKADFRPQWVGRR